MPPRWCLLGLCAGCDAAPAVAVDASAAVDVAPDRPDAPADVPRSRDARVDVPRERADAAAPRCYGVAGAPGLLTHAGSIPRESGGLSNGAGGCVGDVDGDGRREYLLPRMSEPSELIGADLCSRGRVLLPEHARDCVVADVDGQPGAEVVVISNVGWTAEGRVTLGRVAPASPSDDTPERFVWRELAALDDARSIWALGAPHAAVTDLDRDGRAELAVAGSYPTAFLRVWGADGARWATRFAQDLTATVDETHGILSGDLDADGDAEVVLLGACGRQGRHVVRVFDAWAADGFADLALDGPVQGALADLDGAAPPELVLYESWRCDEPRAAPTSGLRVFRHDLTARAMRPVAARAAAAGSREFGFVAALDVAGDPAREVLACTVAYGVAAPPRTCRLFALRGGALEPVPSADAPFVWTSPARRATLASVLVDDLDGDGAAEVFLQGQEHVDVLRGPRR